MLPQGKDRTSVVERKPGLLSTTAAAQGTGWASQKQGDEDFQLEGRIAKRGVLERVTGTDNHSRRAISTYSRIYVSLLQKGK